MALAQYSLYGHTSFDSWRSNIDNWVNDAVAKNAKILVFPEYCSTDLALVAGQANASPNDLISNLEKYREKFMDVFATLASRHKVYIVAGTIPCKDEHAYFNRSYFFSPNGKVAYQDKLILTRFERDKTFLSAGKDITIFETEFGMSAIAICYDAQYPLIAKTMAEAGCNLLISPSCTGSVAGYNRVKIGCQARALENQMAVVQSVTVGDAKWQSIADTNHGAAGAFAPPDNGFPETGVLATGIVDQRCWVYADIDFSAFASIRENGHVLNWKYRDEPTGLVARPIKGVKL
jgi:predicted amidohydrolase